MNPAPEPDRTYVFGFGPLSHGKGRPPKIENYQQLVDLVSLSGPIYGYALYKIFKHTFPKISMRLFYYRMKYSVDHQMLEVYATVAAPGEYSWGELSKRRWVRLGPAAKPNPSADVVAAYTRAVAYLKQLEEYEATQQQINTASTPT
jgi:hypothetical protein